MESPDRRPERPEYPSHAREFPYQRNLDNLVTRRGYLRLLTLTSFGLFLGAAAIAVRAVFPSKSNPRQPVTTVDNVPEGEAYRFSYPTGADPAILVHLPGDRFVAYSQLCTHLACAVLWDRTRSQLDCPCHEGLFDVETGAVIAGPPPRPLPRIDLEVENGTIYATGKEGP